MKRTSSIQLGPETVRFSYDTEETPKEILFVIQINADAPKYSGKEFILVHEKQTRRLKYDAWDPNDRKEAEFKTSVFIAVGGHKHL